jgi:hypothetical protein
VDPVPDPLLLRKSSSAGNRTQDVWICSQELRPLDHKAVYLLKEKKHKETFFMALIDSGRPRRWITHV